MVVVFCPDEIPLHLPQSVRGSVEITADWVAAEGLLRKAAGLIVVQRRLSEGELLSRLPVMRERYPLLRLALAFEMDAANVVAVTHARVTLAHVIDIRRVEEALPAALRSIEAAGVGDLLWEGLAEYGTSSETRAAVTAIFAGPAIPRSAADVARAVGCSQKRLRARVRKDLGLCPHRLLQWARLIRALDLLRSGYRLAEVSLLLKVANTTVERNAMTLLGETLGPAKARGPRATGMCLLDDVRRHGRSQGDDPGNAVTRRNARHGTNSPLT